MAEDEKQTVSGERARQGEVVLRKRWQRGVFIAGLAGIVLLAVLVWIF
ncbi:peptide ABC transporter permease [Parvularcula oceani]|nr:peptide ABC transporter permease [Parvularcula oceani]